MEFKEFRDAVNKKFAEMSENKKHLFVADVNGDSLWEAYLSSYPSEKNKIFRERREHDCSCCRQFVKSIGMVVSIDDQEVTTIWDVNVDDETYQRVADRLSEKVRSASISRVFIPVVQRIGTESNKESVSEGGSYIWKHFYVDLPDSMSLYANTEIGYWTGKMNDLRSVFHRSLEEISVSATETILDLIGQNSLYRGEEWEATLTRFKELQVDYQNADDHKKDLFSWEHSVLVGEVVGKIRNHSMGVLLTDISSGIELDDAVRRYENIVAPSNYKRPKPVFSKRMIESAKEKVDELGFGDSLGRRFAVMEDITVNNILFANRDAKRTMNGDVFDQLTSEVSDAPKDFSKVESIGIKDFIDKVLPSAQSVEVLLENSHESNMVSLIAPENSDAKTMFKWQNNFSWAYSGNVTDSIKENVKAMGGKVHGALRFSIQWNDNDDNKDDLDAHCVEPSGNEIHFSNMYSRVTAGNLDVDIVHPKGVAVENIIWPHKSKLSVGTYRFFVHNYTHRGGKSGFRAEIEFDNSVYRFDYTKPLRQHEKIDVALVNFDGKSFSIEEKLGSNDSAKDIWNIKSNKFHPVSVVMYSPNYWDGKGVGNRHYFFMVDGCRNPDNPNGFYNEFLIEELNDHRKVFAALGSKMKVSDSDRQLSGLGFSSTKRAELVVRVKGSFNRLLKVQF